MNVLNLVLSVVRLSGDGDGDGDAEGGGAVTVTDSSMFFRIFFGIDAFFRLWAILEELPHKMQTVCDAQCTIHACAVLCCVVLCCAQMSRPFIRGGCVKECTTKSYEFIDKVNQRIGRQTQL